MRDLVPEPVLRVIRDRYLAGTADAIAEFASNQADEDSLTGALGQAMSLSPISYRIRDQEFRLRIYYAKLRGRGRNAPEKRFGADGIFQIEVRDENGRVLRSKGLPFQAKKNWSGTNRLLAHQAREMSRELGDGLVIDFRREGYAACSARIAIELEGNRKSIQRSGAFRALGQILAHDFVDCTAGIQDLYYNPDTETFDRRTPGHAITTEIIRERS
jgi:hypothetical protein